MRKIKWIIGLIGLLLLISTTVVGAKSGVLDTLFSKGEQKALSDIKSTATEDLLIQVNDLSAEVSPTGDINVLIPFVSELFERKDAFTDPELLKMMMDDSKTELYRETMVDLYIYKNEDMSVSDDLKKLLASRDMNEQVKTRIVSQGTFTEGDIPLLKQLIMEDDGLLAFHSLKSLSQVDTEAGFSVAEQILSNWETASDDKRSAALQAASEHLQQLDPGTQAYDQIESKFLELSFKLIESDHNVYLTDSAFFAISDLQSEKAIEKIVNSNQIEQELKAFSIDQNYMTLKEMITDNPDEADIQVVLKAMETLPILDLIPPLKAAAADADNDVLRKRIENVIPFIEANGLPGNVKWQD